MKRIEEGIGMGSLFVFGATEQPPIGGIIGIVVFFGAIIALSLWATKSGSKKSANKIKEKYADLPSGRHQCDQRPLGFCSALECAVHDRRGRQQG